MLEKSIILITGLVLLITLKDVLIYETKHHDDSDSNESKNSKILDSNIHQSEYKNSHHSDNVQEYESLTANEETTAYSTHKNQNEYNDEQATNDNAHETAYNQKKIPSLKLKSNIQTLKFKFW
jgi:hypothetical protein